MVTPALWMAAAGLPALAARLEAVLPTDALTVGQTVELTVQLQDGSAKGLPEVPHGPGLQVDYQGQGQSVVSVNFKTTRIQRYTYQLTALSEGIFQVGPVAVEVDGKTLRSEPLRVTVRPRSAAQQAAHSLTASLTDTAPYVGEVVVYGTRYRRTQEIRRGEFTEPTFDSFLPEKNAEPEQKEYAVQEGGQAAMVNERWTALVAAKAGASTIPASLLTLQIPEQRRRNQRYDPFFDRTPTRVERLASEPIPVEVRPLPADSRPDDFSGLVGHFTVAVAPSATQVRLGGSITLDIVLEGDGSLAGFTLPPLAEGAGFRAYDTPGTATARLQDGAFQARLPIERALVPEREGQLTVPPLRLSVFDPQTEQYTWIESEQLTVTVLPGDSASEVASFGEGSLEAEQSIKALGEDILPAPSAGSVRAGTLSAAWPWAAALGLTPLFALVGWSAAGRARRPRTEDARVRLRARLDDLPAEPGRRLAVLESTFRDAAAGRLGVPTPALDRQQIATLGAEADGLAADLDAARYGGASVADLEPRVRAFVEAS